MNGTSALPNSRDESNGSSQGRLSTVIISRPSPLTPSRAVPVCRVVDEERLARLGRLHRRLDRTVDVAGDVADRHAASACGPPAKACFSHCRVTSFG